MMRIDKNLKISKKAVVVSVGLAFLLIATMASTASAVEDTINVNLTVESSGGGNPGPNPACSNGTDDDGDGLIDYPADPGCENFDDDDETDPPPPPPPPPSDEFEITSVTESPNATSSTITWLTSHSAFSVFSWGLTTDYELGSVTESQASTSHLVFLDSLDPETNYFYKIDVTQESNASNTDTHIDSFLTEPLPDSTPPPNPINFNAIYNGGTGAIDLFWDNPDADDFAGVRLMKSEDFYPEDPNDGELIYDGTDEEYNDFDVSPGVTYYYTLFAYDSNGNFSSGVIDDEEVPDEDEDDEPDPEPEPGETECSDGIDNDDDGDIDLDDPGCEDASDDDESNVDKDPFKKLPDGEPDPEIDRLVFEFIQSGEVIARWSGGTVFINGDENLTVRVRYDDLPEELKTIAMTVQSPFDEGRTFTFLLRVNDDKSAYVATIGPLRIDGEYPLQATILNHERQRIRRVQGLLDVSGIEPLVPGVSQRARRVAKTAAPVGTAIGVAAGVTQTVILVFNVGSFYDIYLLILKLFGALFGIFGARRKRKPWGTVYDSVTKRPLDPAYVRVLAENEEVTDAITDLDGRYGFFLPRGRYILRVNKTNYRFPSRQLAGEQSDEIYNNLYFGDPITTEEGEIISRDIPLDPVNFDWNEFVKKQKGLFQLHTRREKIKNIVLDSIFVIGFLFSVLAVIVTPILFNFIVIGVYVLIFGLQVYWRHFKKPATVIDSLTKNPLPFAIIRAYIPGIDQEVKATVADEFGRFYLLVAPGKYYITVEAKQPDGSYKQVYKSGVMELKKGVLNNDLEVDTTIGTKARRWI